MDEAAKAATADANAKKKSAAAKQDTAKFEAPDKSEAAANRRFHKNTRDQS
jgi:hypothetical protein